MMREDAAALREGVAVPREGEGAAALREDVAVGREAEEVVGAEAVPTVMDLVPALTPLAQITITVYVPGPTPDQAADWLPAVPDSADRTPCSKLD
ncbi:hypothetical protein ACWEHT_30515 [Streptomyces sp. NPDC004646]